MWEPLEQGLPASVLPFDVFFVALGRRARKVPAMHGEWSVARTTAHRGPARGREACRAIAFTLIELLVVIAIISLLVSILLPSLNRAKDLAREVACLSNERALGVAHVFYSNDNDETFVYSGRRGGADGFHWFVPGLTPYIEPPAVQTDSTPYLCPADNDRAFYIIKTNPDCDFPPAYLNPDGTADFRLSYAVNGLICPWHQQANQPPNPTEYYVQLTEVEDPSRTVLLTDSIWMYFAWGSDPQWAYRHGGRVSVLFTDNHAIGFQDPGIDLEWWDDKMGVKFLPFPGYWNSWL